jgi:hypothetical protein
MSANAPTAIAVLDPTARGPEERLALPPRLASLRGKVLGVRADRTWASFIRFGQRFAALARERLGVADVVFFDPGIRIGTTEEERHKVAGFVRAVDAAIVGLGT